MSPSEGPSFASRPRIAVSIGDPNGVGPEVFLKCFSNDSLTNQVELIPVGSGSVLDYYRKLLNIKGSNDLLVDVDEPTGFKLTPGKLDSCAGALSMISVERATDMCLAGEVQAMVTCPISKEAISAAGYNFPGHTEFIAERSEAKSYLMMMVSGELRMGLVTAHIPLGEVRGQITQVGITNTISVMASALRSDFGVGQPRIAVLGLNPHAGDGGVLGREEADIIIPAIRSIGGDTNVSGPFPADGFFGRAAWKSFDGVVAMYHDQGLVPFKTLSFGKGVNVTAGLPIVRTSPDHGTAFDIAGRGVAEEGSLHEAILLAAEITARRADAPAT